MKETQPAINCLFHHRANNKDKNKSHGQAVMPISSAPETYTATESFKGNKVYNTATTKWNIIVKKATPKIIASKKTFKLKAKTKKIHGNSKKQQRTGYEKNTTNNNNQRQTIQSKNQQQRAGNIFIKTN